MISRLKFIFASLPMPFALWFGWRIVPPQERDWQPICPSCGDSKPDMIGDESYCCYQCGILFQKPGRLKEKS